MQRRIDVLTHQLSQAEFRLNEGLQQMQRQIDVLTIYSLQPNTDFRLQALETERIKIRNRHNQEVGS